jgi:tetratricopeptide (TPR) repeat protein
MSLISGRRFFPKLNAKQTNAENKNIREIALGYKLNILGIGHPSTTYSCRKLVESCKSMGKKREAMKYAIMASHGSKFMATHAGDIPISSDSMKLDVALQESTTNEHVKMVEGHLSCEYAVELNELGVSQMKNRQYVDARNNFEKAIEIFESKHPEEHRFARKGILMWLAVLYCNYALALHSGCPGTPEENQVYDVAVGFYEKGLNLYFKEIGPKHPRLHKIVNDLAGLYKKMGRIDRAKILLVDVLKRMHPNTTRFYHKYAAMLEYNLAKMHEGEEDWLQTMERYKKVRIKYLRNCKNGKIADLLCIRIENDVGVCLIESGEYEQAIVVLEVAIRRLRTHKTLRSAPETSRLMGLMQSNLRLARDWRRTKGHIFRERYANRVDL